jgi:threonine synthase
LTEKINIWHYAERYSPLIKEGDRLSFGEGGVRCVELPGLNEELSDGITLRRFIFKREDENPTGSHKARALAYQVSYYRAKGEKTLLISSSGNAAIAAADYCRLCGIRLIAFVSKNTPRSKINEIKNAGQTVLFCEKPINFAKYAARIFNIQNLRPSHDDLSIEPYKSIAFELFDEFSDDIDAVFIFPTSASSLIGTARGYLQLRDELGVLKRAPKIIAVQTGGITSIAEQFVKKTGEAGTSAAGALGVKVTRRTEEAVEIIKKLAGTAVIVSSDEISEADAILKRYGIITSEEGAASFAGAIKLHDYKNVVCILSGREYKETEKEVEGSVFYADSYTDVRNIIKKLKV